MPPGDEYDEDEAPLFPGLFGRMSGAARRRGARIGAVPGNDIVSKFEKAVSKFEKAVGSLTGKADGTGGGGGSYTAGHITGAAAAHRSAASGGRRPPGVHDPTPDDLGDMPRGWRAAFAYDPTAALMATQQIGALTGRAGGAVSGYFARQRDPMMALTGMASMGSQFGFGGRESLMRGMAGSIWGGDVAGHVAIENAALRAGPQGYSIMRSLGFAGSVNPLIDQQAVATSYQSMFSPGALRAMVPFGGAAVLNGGRMNGDFGDVLNRYIRAAAGGRGAGQMTERQAQATFGLYGQGRATLQSYFGLDDAAADLAQQYAAGSARLGRRVNLNNEAEVREYLGDDFIMAQQRREGRGLRADVDLFNDTKDGQIAVANALGLLEQNAKGAASALGNLIPFGGALSGVAGSMLGMLGDIGGTAMALGLGRSTLGRLGAKIPGGALMGRAVGGAARFAGRGLVLGGASMAGEAVGEAITGGSDWGGLLGSVGAGAAAGGIAGMGIGSVPGVVVGGIAGGVGWGISKLLGGDPADDTEMDKILGDKYGAQWTNLNPIFRRKLAAMFRANPKLVLTSGWRSTEAQRHLYEEWRAGRHRVPSVARPGRSNHEKGLAADIGPRSEYGWIGANAAKHGLTASAVRGEPWHVEPIGAKNMASTASGSMPSSSSTPPAGGAGGGSFTIKQGSLAYSISAVLGTTSIMRLGGGSGAPDVSRAPQDGGGSSGGGGGLLDTLRAAGFAGESLRVAYAVAMAESGGRATAHNPNARTGDNSYGLFQINMLGRMGPDRRRRFGLSRNEDLFDPATNARVAFEMSGGGTNWAPWSTYKSGAYRRHYSADIGDPAEGGAGVTTVRGGNSVVVHLSMPMQVVRATEQEAQRLVEMVATKLERDDRIKALAGR